jgi:hypothetical protein
MNTTNNIGILLLIKNEEKNLEQFFSKNSRLKSNIYIVDSFSDDNSIKICNKYTNNIYYNKFISHSNQIQWALNNIKFTEDWILRLDADEFLSEKLIDEIIELNLNDSSISAYYLNRRVYFMGKWIRWGGYYPCYILRLFKFGSVRIEDKKMDEHFIMNDGFIHGYLKNDIIEINNKSISEWIIKHNRYSDNEVDDIIFNKNNTQLNGLPLLKRLFKKYIYLKLPLIYRAFLFWLYRYIFRLGFLDGKYGLVFHFLQCLWYRLIVDLKIMEKKNEK